MDDDRSNPFGWLPAEVLGAVIQVVADGVLVVDRSGTILQANDAFGRLCQREPWELEGSPIELLLADDDVPLGEQIGELVAEAAWSGRTRLRRSDGSLVECETWMAAADVDQGEVFVAVQHDQQVIRRYGRTVIDDVEARVHELVNSLASLRGYADLLHHETGEVADEARDRLHAAARLASDRLEALLTVVSE